MRLVLTVGLVLVSIHAGTAQTAHTEIELREEAERTGENQIDKTYADESHCLTAPEIRTDADSAFSCWCRDALVDARYVYRAYLITGKDRNLNVTYLALVAHAEKWCGERYNYSRIHSATQDADWKWDGPEVIRRYPTDEEIKAHKPDANGVRTVPYLVTLIRRNGKESTAETFTAIDRVPALLLGLHEQSAPKK